jgi:phosphoribosylformylglycinamidine synthase
MSDAPRALVVRTAGTNCDVELARAFTLAGAQAESLHLDRLCGEPDLLDAYQLIGFPGGFSYGDDIASGRILAMRARTFLYPALRRAVERGACIGGICNGFQALVQTGLLPGPDAGQPWPDEPPAQRVALTDNIAGRFVDRWSGIKVEPASRCVWTRGLADAFDADAMQLPSAHGEGRLVADSGATLDALDAGGQVALRYRENFNGSSRAIAGICDATGRVFGLMPHPERYLDWTRHPWWTRLDAAQRRGDTPGLAMFRNAVAAAAGAERRRVQPA